MSGVLVSLDSQCCRSNYYSRNFPSARLPSIPSEPARRPANTYFLLRDGASSRRGVQRADVSSRRPACAMAENKARRCDQLCKPQPGLAVEALPSCLLFRNQQLTAYGHHPLDMHRRRAWPFQSQSASG